MDGISNIADLNHYFLAMVVLITMVLISRTIVAGTKYSAILIIVVFGLLMGALLVQSGMATPGLNEFPAIVLVSQTTIIALIATFFVGGQEIRRLLANQALDDAVLMTPADDEVILGTSSTQLFFITRAYFILVGIETAHVLLGGRTYDFVLGNSYLLFAYVSLVLAILLIDSRARLTTKPLYIRKGVVEILGILLVLQCSLYLAGWIEPLIALPQIFFAMILSSALGAALPRWRLGPTLNSLLFAGIPVLLAGTFLVGGSRMLEAFTKAGVIDVIVFGFAGQLFWMFSGLAILVFLARANHLRNLAPGMAGGLSHSGLTGACTAGDFGQQAAVRAPIMINVPFITHIFVFSILAASAARGSVIYGLTIPLIAVGAGCVVVAVRKLRHADGDDVREIKALMLFALGWQVVAVFGSFTILDAAGMDLAYVSLAVASALSHFGLFAAVQGGMFGDVAASLIVFIFAMPFLAHPLVFWSFGKAAERDGQMNANLVLAIALIGLAGVAYSLITN